MYLNFWNLIIDNRLHQFSSFDTILVLAVATLAGLV